MKINSHFLYLCEFIPNKFTKNPDKFTKIFEIYDTELQGFIFYKIEFIKNKSWKCFVNDIESNIENTLLEFNINKNTNLKFIYLLKAENTTVYKIGKTSYLNHRCKDFSVNLPFQTTLTNWFIGNPKDEFYLHKIFKNCRLNGEWFNLTNKELSLFFLIRENWIRDFTKKHLL